MSYNWGTADLHESGGSRSGHRCAGTEGIERIFILSSWMADDRISWRRRFLALISFVSFKEEIRMSWRIYCL